MNSNPQTKEFTLTEGALGYRTRSDATATPRGYLVSGSQNVLINEATDKQGDKVESRGGYTMQGAESTDRNGIISEFVFKTKAGNTLMGRMDDNGDLEFYSETSAAWETLYTGLNGSYPLRWCTIWNASELIREILFVNHSSTLYEWSGAFGTLAVVAAGTITINEAIGTSGFLTAGTRSIRIKDSGGTWRETVYTAQSGSDFTVSSDLSGFTFSASALVVQVVRANTTTPASGFTNDIIAVLENHVYVGSHSSSVVYMSKSTSFIDFTFSSPRIATDGWQFVLDDYTIGFKTNLTGSGQESIVMFAGNDWIYRVEFVDLGDASISQIAKIKPIIVSSGQGAVSQELIAKMKNAIIYLNASNELLDLSSVENLIDPDAIPISDSIKPDFLAADFTGGSIRFFKNNLYVAAAASGRLFILSFRQTAQGSRSFWQPPQLLPVGQMSEYAGNLIGHSPALTESYVLFDGTNDNGQPISFKAHFAYDSFEMREKLKAYDKYFAELYLTSNATVRLICLYEYLAAKTMRTYEYNGADADFTFTPNPSAALGVNSLGTSPLGAVLESIPDLIKYRRFKKVAPLDFFEHQTRFECDDLDARFQILAHGPNVTTSKNAPVKFTN
jgi:hypothetical protein